MTKLYIAFYINLSNGGYLTFFVIKKGSNIFMFKFKFRSLDGALCDSAAVL